MGLRLMEAKPEGRPAWEPCGDCEEFWCNVHGMHAHDCDFPPVDEWDTDPYSTPIQPPAGAAP